MIFGAAVACLTLSVAFLWAMEERPLRTGAARAEDAEAIAVPAE
jgi:hypothetical protein